MSTPSVIKRLKHTLLVVGMFLVLLGIVLFVNFRRFTEAERWHTHTYEVLVENNAMSRALDDMDISAHNYALTGDTTELEALTKSQAEFAEHYNRILGLTSDNKQQQQRLRSLIQQQARWTEAYIEPIKALNSS